MNVVTFLFTPLFDIPSYKLCPDSPLFNMLSSRGRVDLEVSDIKLIRVSK